MQVRTPAEKESLTEHLEAIIYDMQRMAEVMDCLGNTDAFEILDAAAERLRELSR